MHNPPIYLSRKVQFTTTEIWLLICSFTTCTKPAKSILITTMALWQIGAKCLLLFSPKRGVIRQESVRLKGHTIEKLTNHRHRCSVPAHHLILLGKYGKYVSLEEVLFWRNAYSRVVCFPKWCEESG